MKPRIKLAESLTASGDTMSLYEHDSTYGICINGRELMNSRFTYSEVLLGQIGVEALNQAEPNRVLIGGLGLGFTLRSVLEGCGETAKVDVAELLPAVIEWNQTYLRDMNGALLDDPRVQTLSEDVNAILQQAAPATYDAIMLDIDNGPVAMVQSTNQHLYSKPGILSVFKALKEQGRLAVWSASIDNRFENLLRKVRAKFSIVRAKATQKAKRASYVIYVIQQNHYPKKPKS